MRRFVLFAASLAIRVAAQEPAGWARLAHDAGAFEEAGNYQQAVDCWRSAMRGSVTDANLWTAAVALAADEAKLGHILEADRQYRTLLGWISAAKGEENADYATVLANLGTLHLENEQLAAGVAELRQALAIAERVYSPDDVRIPIARSGLAAALIRSRQYDDAARLLENSLAALQSHRDTPPEDTAFAMSNLAVARQLQGRGADAAAMLEQAQATLAARFGPEHPAVLHVISNLADAYAAAGRPVDADRTFRRACAIAEEKLPPDHPLAARIFQRYAAFLRAQGHKREAKRLEARSKTAYRESARRNGAGMIIDAADFRATH